MAEITEEPKTEATKDDNVDEPKAEVVEPESVKEPQPEVSDALKRKEVAPALGDAEVVADAQQKEEANIAVVNDDEKKEEAKKDDDNADESVDFSGTWVLKSSSKSIDEYYKSEGWSYVMRKMAPFVPMKQVIKQDGDKLQVNMIVGPGGKFANETTSAVIGGDEVEYKDKDGKCMSKSRWNEDKTQILSDIYRVDHPKHTYKMVRAFSMLSDDKMIVTTTNSHGKELVQNYEKHVPHTHTHGKHTHTH